MKPATTTLPHLPGKASLALLRTWWPVLLGLAVLYLPTWWDLAHGLWSTEEQGHGPLILAVSLYLVWQQREVFRTSPRHCESRSDVAIQQTTPHQPLDRHGLRPRDDESAVIARSEADAAIQFDAVIASEAKQSSPRPILGWSLLVFGLLAYALGRSQEILLFEVGSQIPVLLGVLLITLGGRAVKALWFPILFLAFMVPLPGFLVDALTGPLKQFASVVAEQVLYAVGYPIGRSGVMLTVGHYQLLVADACSGLHSIFSLSALGLLYLHMMRHPSWLRNGILLASIVPIAVAANVVRVMLLILITYHFGDSAGQGFAHDFAGIALFLAALMLLFGLDGALGLFIKKKS